MRHTLFVSLVLFLFVCSTVCDNFVDDESSAASSSSTPESYDFIVVGAGAGGSVIAGRLSENGTYSVLVLDAGARSQASVGGTDYVASRFYFDSNNYPHIQKPLTRYDVPAFAGTAQTFDTPYSPTPGFALNSPQGYSDEHSRILGGMSVHNNMQWNRQSIPTINSWNLPGWSFQDLLPYFKKSENFSATHLKNDNVYHGQSGPIEVAEAQALDKAGPIFIESCIKAGYGYTNDFSGPQPIGCGPPLFNINSRGIRSSSVHEYLAPALKRSNVKLIVNAWVSKILFYPASYGDRKVKGIQYVRQYNNGTYDDVSKAITVLANKEVILGGGSFNSPKLLMLSGIGPKQHLQSKGINVIVDSPVGKRQGIHPIVVTNFKYQSDINNPNFLTGPSIEYALNGTGLFASVGFPVQALLKSDPSLSDYDITLVGNVASPFPGQFQVYTLLLNPTQRNGETLLQSAFYREAPYFNYTLLQSDADVTALARSIQINRNITKVYPANVTFGTETVPGPQYNTLAKLKQYVKTQGGLFSTTHLFGGCQMGGNNDPLAPLDNRARVKGVIGVRVCDMSITPGAFNGSPQTNIIAWCEKISEQIIADHCDD